MTTRSWILESVGHRRSARTGHNNGGKQIIRRATFQKRPPPTITTNVNCLLVPVVLVAWWYWTKRMARQAIARVVDPSTKATSTIDNRAQGLAADSDEFSTWEDVVEHQTHRDGSDNSVGFVRWLRSPTSSTASITTARSNSSSGTKKLMQLAKKLSRKKQSLAAPILNDDDEESSVLSTIRWESLPNRGIELDVISSA